MKNQHLSGWLGKKKVSPQIDHEKAFIIYPLRDNNNFKGDGAPYCPLGTATRGETTMIIDERDYHRAYYQGR